MTLPPWRVDLPLSSINQNDETLLDLGDYPTTGIIIFYKNSLSHLDGWMDGRSDLSLSVHPSRNLSPALAAKRFCVHSPFLH